MPLGLTMVLCDCRKAQRRPENEKKHCCDCWIGRPAKKLLGVAGAAAVAADTAAAGAVAEAAGAAEAAVGPGGVAAGARSTAVGR